MDVIFSLILLTLGVLLAVFIVECLLGLRASAATDSADPTPLSAAILMPAHNEAEVIGETLSHLKPLLGSHDTVLVVADNCSDNTAEIVRAHGFEVAERSSERERGKGYALDFGMQQLKQWSTTPDIVIIFDADCFMESGALEKLKQKVLTTKRPVQACYLMKRGDITRIAVKVSEFAFYVKNKIRLRGLAKLNMPVPLTGTGMAFPWQAIADATLATGDIVEDMRLGVELAERGLGARYCDEAVVYSFFPSSEAAEKTQRERWEHGHLSTLRQFVPRLLKRAIKDKSTEAFVMMLDLSIPPLSLLVMLMGGALGGFLVWGLITNVWIYASISAWYLLLLMFTILLVWGIHGRKMLSVRELLHIPVYVVSKLVIYLAYIVRKQTKWIRTDRH